MDAAWTCRFSAWRWRSIAPPFCAFTSQAVCQTAVSVAVALATFQLLAAAPLSGRLDLLAAASASGLPSIVPVPAIVLPPTPVQPCDE